MAKMVTPQMEAINRKLSKRKKTSLSFWDEAWRRLRRNKTAMAGMIILIVLIVLAVFANVIAPYGPTETDNAAIMQGPSLRHLMGTDNFGRDILSRVISGARISLTIGLFCVIISALIGGTIGAIAAFYGGWVDNLLMRFIDIYQSIPNLLLAIAIAAALGTGMFNLMLAISLGTVPVYARVVRGAILSVKGADYVESARAISASDRRIILKHMLPNALGPIIVQMTFGVAASILTVATLSYIGLGIAPPTPEWGSMVNAGKQYLQTAPYMIIFPGLMIGITVLSLNLFGDGLRDALDPRMK